MEKLTILLLVAAVLMSTQALIQDQRQKAKINLFSKRQAYARDWWDDGCSVWGPCTVNAECCSGDCHETC
uniref:O2 superfamily conotoxin Tx7.29 n=1 Tax=Conus textile TaxID=6494 RepID=S4UJT2_CONTE|nr:O2 superfamily conotoxin Tx7.29 precursor [Conus textile]AGK23297.1 O2 superfamily conotoxin Tx7.29 precursor [Conus textile]